MYMYTVYPALDVRRKQPIRHVEPVSRVKAAGQVESGHIIRKDATEPLQQLYESQKAARGREGEPGRVNKFGGFQTAREQSGRERPIGELYIQNMLPMLLAWRRPKAVADPDYIEKRHDGLRAAQASRAGIEV